MRGSAGAGVGPVPAQASPGPAAVVAATAAGSHAGFCSASVSPSSRSSRASDSSARPGAGSVERISDSRSDCSVAQVRTSSTSAVSGGVDPASSRREPSLVSASNSCMVLLIRSRSAAAPAGSDPAPDAAAARLRPAMPSTSSSRRWACSRWRRAFACSPKVSA